MRALPLLLLVACGGPDATLSASTTTGTLPLLVQFNAEGSDSWDYAWQFGDGSTSTGRSVEHLFLSSGTFEVELLVTAGAKEQSETLTITVEPESCPSFAEATTEATVADGRLAELSGIGVSRSDEVVFAHQDSGDGPNVYAISRDDGTTLDEWSLGAGAASTDWEDLALATDASGATFLYVGDIGDNSAIRSDVSVYRLPEPAPNGELGPMERFDLTYPDGAHDAETLLVDPQSGDVFVLTKSSSGDTGLYAAPSPLRSGMLTLAASLAFGTGELTGNKTTTGGDISLHGNQIVVRTYTEAYVWLRDGGTVGEAMTGSPCRVPLFVEPQGEAIAFTPEGDLMTVSEGLNPALYLYERD